MTFEKWWQDSKIKWPLTPTELKGLFEDCWHDGYRQAYAKRENKQSIVCCLWRDCEFVNTAECGKECPSFTPV